MRSVQGSGALYKPHLGHLQSQSSRSRREDAEALETRTSKEGTVANLSLRRFLLAAMWKSAFLALCLLAAAAAQPMDDPAYGVKLCGREFIRAVIFTCGGSRWRRSVRSADVSEELLSFPQEESMEGWNRPSVGKSLLQRSGDLGLSSAESQDAVFSRPGRSFITEEILEALRKADRKGRDVVVGLSNACCKWGCSKSEISSLC